MPHLLLIKHASVEVEQSKPPSSWHLSEKGRGQVPALAEKLRAHQPKVVVTSVEPKAMQTGDLLAATLNVPVERADGLHEHDRDDVQFMKTNIFISAMALFFSKPNDRRLGNESASEALARFEAAIDGVIAKHPDQEIAVVSHGTVIALLVEKLAGDNPFVVWREMGLPSYVVIDTTTKKIVERMNAV